MKKSTSAILFAIVFMVQSISLSAQKKIKKNGKEFIQYAVKAGDGWYAIARKFEVSYAELREANHSAGDKLNKGMIILVPQLKTASIKTNTTKEEIKPEAHSTMHVVKKGETVFSISKSHQVSVAEIKNWNHLKGNSISVGERLIIHKIEVDKHSDDNAEKSKEKFDTERENELAVEKNKIKELNKTNTDRSPALLPKLEEKKSEAIATKQETEVTAPVSVGLPKKEVSVVEPLKEGKAVNKEVTLPENKKVVFGKGRKEVNETGVAAWIEDEDVNPNKYYALHRTAPTGTIIKIINRMNSVSLFVKVIGRLPDTGDNDGLLIKISKASADKLGVLDQRFQCELLYGLENNPKTE